MQKNATARAVSALFRNAYPHSYVGIGIRQKKQDSIVIKKWVRQSELTNFFSKFIAHQNTDLYITNNTYCGGFHKQTISLHRRENKLLSINNIVIDVDLHKSNERPERQRELLKEYIKDVDKAIAKHDMPQYHVWVFTGRGLQFWYTIESLAIVCQSLVTVVSKGLVAKHEAVKRQEHNMFKYGFYDDLDIDASASKRISGLFRLPFTYNTAIGIRGKVHIVDDYKVPHINDLLEFFGVEKRLKQEATTKSKSSSTRGTKQSRYFPLLSKRRAILEYIDVDIGRRETACFLYYNTVVQIFGNNELAVKALERFNNKFACPLRTSQLCSIERAVNRVGFYHFKESTFYEAAQISNEEMTSFMTKYMPPSVAKREAKRAKKRALKIQRDDKIRELALEGKTYNEIEKEVHVSQPTIAKILVPNKAINTVNARKEKQRKQIAAMLEAGKTWDEMTATLGISRMTLSRRIKEMKKSNK